MGLAPILLLDFAASDTQRTLLVVNAVRVISNTALEVNTVWVISQIALGVVIGECDRALG